MVGFGGVDVHDVADTRVLALVGTGGGDDDGDVVVVVAVVNVHNNNNGGDSHSDAADVHSGGCDVLG